MIESQVRKEAESYFNNGLCCAESVLLALANARGIKSDLIPRIATGFCGGMGHTNSQCGAVSGAIMGIDLVLGRTEPDQSRDACYAAVQRLVGEFEAEFDTRNCYALLGCDPTTPEGKAYYTEHQLNVRCTEFTGRAAEIAARCLKEADQ